MVFFTGSLQEGISTALQQSKLVVCFVTDNEAESQTWESEFLTDEAIAPQLASDAVVLRLEAGSQEASYLAAIFPLPKTPTLVIIRNGELKEYVSAGTHKEDFVRRVGNAFVSPTAAPNAATPVASSVPASSAAPPADTPSSTGQNTPGSSTSDNSPISDADRQRKGKGKIPASEGAQQQPAADAKAGQRDAAKHASQQNAERKAKAREERARVLKLIADDKAERKARDEERRQERELARRAAAGEEEEEVEGPSSQMAGVGVGAAASSSVAGKQHGRCALQVRLFDGSTIRARFPSDATLSTEVRQWIDEARTDETDPYTFKVILTPLPNRSIDLATEEEQSLEQLGLTPSATLVLAPVDKHSEAYTTLTNTSRNPISRLLAAMLTFILNILSGIAGALGGLGSSGGSGGGGAARSNAGNDAQGQQATTSGRDAGGRIKGFRDADARRKDHQFYNGNSLSFEPRKDEGDEDDKDK
ncbi:hypothetical protein BD289DRAFT_500788 [Coniella lustricola]|uniref:UBX domain-containing protein 2 n=1 Tax=Coniella lustricola TaxID=2025994 RepID=A0A2T3A6S5_9PEZI|nr:hypothetical protein BD289DRAFT_500788 [Coniella lustricola]